MSENKKVTKKEYFMQNLEVVGNNDEPTEFVNHETELLDKENLTKSVEAFKQDMRKWLIGF